MVEWLAGNRIRGTSTERTTGTTTYSTITKDNQAIIQRGSATPSSGQGGTGLVSGTFSNFAVGNNSNRVLIIASGCYNASPNITGVTFNGSENFEKITQYKPASGFNHEFWILYNPTVTTADVVITYGTSSGFEAGAGQTGAICYSFYGVKQSDAFGTPVEKNSGASATPFIAITPTTAGSMIIDCYFSGAGSPVPNNDETDGMNIICGGVDRSMASQYDLSPTIGSANNMSRTSGNSSYSQIAVEIKAFATVIPSLMQVDAVSGGWKELGRITAGGSSTTMDVTGLADKRYLQFIVYSNLTSSNTINNTLNGITTNTYAERHNIDGGSDVTTASTANLNASLGFSATPKFQVGYISNLDTKEKLALWWEAIQNTAGSGTAPRRIEFASKHVQTTNPIDQFTTTSGSGNFPSGSEVVVLGWDEDDTHTDNFWEELASVELGSASNSISTGTFTAKKYLQIQCYVPSSTGGADNYVIRVGNNTIDSGSNYSQRYNINGGDQGSGTQVNQDKIRLAFNISSGSEWFFANSFIINNSGNEKLLISHANRNSGAGANSPPSRYEMVGKWDNTSNQINIIELLHQNSSSSLGAGTIIKVWGSD